MKVNISGGKEYVMKIWGTGKRSTGFAHMVLHHLNTRRGWDSTFAKVLDWLKFWWNLKCLPSLEPIPGSVSPAQHLASLEPIVDLSPFLASRFARANWWTCLISWSISWSISSSQPVALLELIGGPVSLRNFSRRSRQLVEQPYLLSLSLRSRQLLNLSFLLSLSIRSSQCLWANRWT